MMSVPSPHVLAAIVLVVVSIVYVILTKTTFVHRLLVFIVHRVLRQSSSTHTTKRLPDGTCRHGDTRLPARNLGVAIHNLVLPGSAFPADLGPVRIESIAVQRVVLQVSHTIELLVDGVDVQLHQLRMPQV